MARTTNARKLERLMSIRSDYHQLRRFFYANATKKERAELQRSIDKVNAAIKEVSKA